jgi:hypothetical protein
MLHASSSKASWRKEDAKVNEPKNIIKRIITIFMSVKPTKRGTLGCRLKWDQVAQLRN